MLVLFALFLYITFILNVLCVVRLASFCFSSQLYIVQASCALIRSYVTFLRCTIFISCYASFHVFLLFFLIILLVLPYSIGPNVQFLSTCMTHFFFRKQTDYAKKLEIKQCSSDWLLFFFFFFFLQCHWRKTIDAHKQWEQHQHKNYIKEKQNTNQAKNTKSD